MKTSSWMGFAAMTILAGALLTVWDRPSPGQDPAKPAVVTWGYKTIFGTSGQSTNDDELNRLGKEGWELFAIQQEGNNVVRFVLKRASLK